LLNFRNDTPTVQFLQHKLKALTTQSLDNLKPRRPDYISKTQTDQKLQAVPVRQCMQIFQLSQNAIAVTSLCYFIIFCKSFLRSGQFLSADKANERLEMKHLEQFPKSVKRFSDKNCGENKELRRR